MGTLSKTRNTQNSVLRWYLRYSLSLRDVEELLTERGLDADHTRNRNSGYDRTSSQPINLGEWTRPAFECSIFQSKNEHETGFRFQYKMSMKD